MSTPEWKWEIKEGEKMEITNSEGVKVNVTGPATIYADVSKHNK